MDLQIASFIVSGLLVIIGLYGVFFIDNVLKKIIALEFLGNGVNLFLIAIGYNKIIPIKLPGISNEFFIKNSAYPLTHALVLTNIVIEASMLAVMLGIAIILYKKYKTLKGSVILKED
ncbi:monovalent cation/H+ antiporter subunit C [Methanocaldococcus villosus KIN24-T80]|uniref:Monovalent cation/H+ antiporter subunit C n=1 Tax=Methanocaldococcus villosus KIN24-T80 TaxID=1069083 RepID=N6W085_9EURY|nr:cation:proton antiporter subunit C [Methanocaldococcus villosus]ENN96777.1 monovalent cation/H+ antiporter subunit C [Methanocaldococcus villosus KIN24-T80]